MADQSSGLLRSNSSSSTAAYQSVPDGQDSGAFECAPGVSLPKSVPKSLLHLKSDGSFGVLPASSHFTTRSLMSSPSTSKRRHVPLAKRHSIDVMETVPDHRSIEIIQHKSPSRVDVDHSGSEEPWDRLVGFVGVIPGFIIGCVLNLMLCVPFGLAFFPSSWEPLPYPRTVGVQMFLLSTAISQVVFALCSGFPSSMGMMMVENIPFMHSLAFIVMQEQGQGPDAMSTLVVLFAISSIVVGIMFFFLGQLKLGAFIYFIPRHVIIGCIGGVGVFVTKTGFEVSTGVPFDWTRSAASFYLTESYLPLWLVSLALVVVLRVSQRLGMRRYSLFPPAYFVAVAPLFYIVVALIPSFGFPEVDVDAARRNGWFFPAEESAPCLVVFQMFDFSLVRWSVIIKGIPTILALTAFSLMHVPINVPSLSSSTSNDSIDMNHELVVHGYSNLLSGILGGTQNYLCYSNSLLYWKCKGKGRIAGLCLAAATIYFFVQGPNSVQYVPRCMAGCLLIHLGLELVKEALVDSFYLFDVFEFVSVLIITITMTAMGMTAGLGVGVLLAVSTFTLQIGKSSQPIRRARRATTLRSSRYRNAACREVLSDALRDVLVLQLQGTVFFGNATILCQEIGTYVRTSENLRTVILDFTLVHYIDTSACDTIASTVSLAKRHGVSLVFVRGSHEGFPCEKNKGFLTESIKQAHLQTEEETVVCASCMVVDRLDDALFAIEEQVLKGAADTAATDIPSPRPGTVSTPEELFVHLFSEEDSAAVTQLFTYFTMKSSSDGDVLWRVGQTSNRMVFVGTGTVLSVLDESDNQATELVYAGNIIGDYAFLVKGTHTTTVICKEQCLIYELDKKGLAVLLDREPRLAFVLAKLTISYLGHRTTHVSNRIWETHCVPI